MLGGNSLMETVAWDKQQDDTCQVGGFTPGREMNTRLPPRHWHPVDPAWPEEPQRPGEPGWQQLPEEMPGSPLPQWPQQGMGAARAKFPHGRRRIAEKITIADRR